MLLHVSISFEYRGKNLNGVHLTVLGFQGKKICVNV